MGEIMYNIIWSYHQCLHVILLLHLTMSYLICSGKHIACFDLLWTCSRSTITREKFEELCEDIWEKALAPLKEVMKDSGLKADDLYAVELIGGATRVPKLQVFFKSSC